MTKLIVNGKIFSLAGEFWVTDENENPRYQIKGSFLKIPKYFQILDENGQELARVTHKVFSLLPKFFLEINGQEVAVISKKISLFKPKYDIEAAGIQVSGNIWDMNFEILRKGQLIGRVDKQWLSLRDKYAIEITNPDDELLVLGLVMAIDYVKKAEATAASSAN
jgi:uncharacterized protein YxjI